MELGLEGMPLREVVPPDELFDKERLGFAYNSAREAVLRELDRQPEGMCFAEARTEAEEVRRVLRIARRQLRHQRGRNLALLGRCSPDAAARGRAAGEEVRALRRKLASLDAEAQELSAEVEAAESGHEVVVDELKAIRDEMKRWKSAVESLEDSHAAASAPTPPSEPAPLPAPAPEPASPPGRRGEADASEARGNFRLALDRTSLLKGQQQPRPEAPARAQSGGGSYLPPGSATPVRAVSTVVQLSGLSTPVQTVVVSARSPGSASPLPACRLSCGSLLGNVTPLQASARNTRSTGSASPSLESSPLNSYRIGASASAASLPGRSATPLQPAVAPGTRCLQPSQSCGSVHLVCSRASSPRQLTSAPLPVPPLPSPQQGAQPRGCPQPLLSPPRARAAPAQAPPTPPIAGVGRGIWQMTAQQPLM